MNTVRERFFKCTADQRGFTLIEMAIVLIIIGVIIGAVVKGKDLIRSAEQKKIYTKYVNAWRLCYANFYDRTGKRLGDFYDAAGTAEGQDGQCDTDIANDGITAADRALLEANGVKTTFYGLTDVGLTVPTTNLSNCYEYKYTDSQGTGHTMTIALKYDGTGKYNYLWIDKIPNELGIALDTMIDGEADGTAGDFLAYNTPADDTNAAWGAPTTSVSARWKMEF